MPRIKIITIECDRWDAPRPVSLTPSMTTAQILREVEVDWTGALLHQRTTVDPISGLRVRHSWMGRNKPYKQVVAGDVLRAVQLRKTAAKNPADQT